MRRLNSSKLRNRRFAPAVAPRRLQVINERLLLSDNALRHCDAAPVRRSEGGPHGGLCRQGHIRRHYIRTGGRPRRRRRHAEQRLETLRTPEGEPILANTLAELKRDRSEIVAERR
jgi:hypothetical protein